MQKFIQDYLRQIVPVSFRLETAEEFIDIGEELPRFTVRLNADLKKRELLTSTSLALGEAYMRGDIEVDADLYEVLDTFLGRMDSFHTNRAALGRILRTSRNAGNQKKEVCAHYDIGNDFYRLWLDGTMSYSCAYFIEGQEDLYSAQVDKADHILKKLCLKPGMTLLDIGCGWGFLLRRAAEKYGAKGVGITLSEEQYRECREAVHRERLGGAVTIMKMDYRDIDSLGMSFDRVVSVGMLEHVGRGNYELFLRKVKGVMKPGGLFLLHYISALKEYSGDPFIKKYIFPGGVIPSLREILHIMGEEGMYTLDVESLRRHYTKTLLCWRENLLRHRKEIEKQYGEGFMRMWELYLASCAATFHNGIIDLHQILMSRGVNNGLPMTREYML